MYKIFQYAKYILIESYRKNGVSVKTPVWFVIHDGIIYVRTNKDSGKVKRIKNNSTIKISICNIIGKPNENWHEAEAKVIEFDEYINSLIDKKYGFMAKLLKIFYKLKKITPCIISIKLV